MKKIKANRNDLESCSKCTENNPLKTEIENLKQRLIDRNITIVQMEANMSQELLPYSQGQLATLRATCENWQDKYDRLLEAHKRIQRVNQGLEDKLLRLVDRSESEKAKLAQDSINLTTALTTAAQAINRLKSENTRYQNDLSIAVQLLQCNSSQYIDQKLNMFPHDLHQKIRSRITPDVMKPQKPKSEPKVIRVPIPTFPPTAMVYSVNRCGDNEEDNDKEVDVVSAAIMAAILEEREREKSQRHCPTCTCKLPTESTRTNNSSRNSSYDNLDSNDDFQNVHGFSKVINSSNGSHLEGSSQAGRRSSTFGVNAIDVGTQTIPSYIGETGKVRSTCIYCQSSKAVGDKGASSLDSSSESNVSVDSPLLLPRLHKQDNDDCHIQPSFNQDKLNCKQPLSWDWHAESQDSGSPPSPTSLTSASMSYESETSCFTSPQESPGRISLHSISSACKIPEQELGLSTSSSSIAPLLKTYGNQPKLKINKGFLQSVPNVRLDMHSNLNISSSHRIPSNSHYFDQDGFTIPIHLSPPLRRSVSDTESCHQDSLTINSLSSNNISTSKSALKSEVPTMNNGEPMIYKKKPIQSSCALQTLINKNISNGFSDENQSFYDDTMKSIDIVISSLKGSSLEDFCFDSNSDNCPVIVASTFTRSATETTL